MLRQCDQCGKAFAATPYQVEHGWGRFCSRACGYASHVKPKGKATAWRHFNQRDGRWYRKWREDGSRRVYSQLEHRWMWEQAHGPIPTGHEIHHRNHDPADNRLDNLELVTQEWHDNYHQRLREDHRVIDGQEERRCQRCHEWKALTQFSVRRAGTYHGYCKSCVVDYLRQWRADHAEDVKRKRKERYRTIENPERIRTHQYTRGPYKSTRDNA